MSKNVVLMDLGDERAKSRLQLQKRKAQWGSQFSCSSSGPYWLGLCTDLPKQKQKLFEGEPNRNDFVEVSVISYLARQASHVCLRERR
jgi:hypothetical protein